MDYIVEHRVTPVADSCDALVAGGGIVGTAMTDDFGSLDVAALRAYLYARGVRF